MKDSSLRSQEAAAHPARPAFRYLSVCSGIEAASVAWHQLGWEPAAFSEIEKFPRAVLAERWPGVPVHGNFTTIRGDEYGPVQLLVGGTPCQDFSVAGLRAGIAGERGNLTLEFLRLAARMAPRWIVWENVPGVLSSDGGRALGAFLGGLAELGYGFAYRVLDAQYFDLAQRRARVFVVGYLGDWRRAAAVLFERESLLGNPPPRRQAGQRAAPNLSARTQGGGGLGTDFDCDGGLVQQWPAEVAPTLNAHFGDKQGLEDQHALNGAGLFVAHALRGEGFDASEDGTGRGTPLITFGWQNSARQGASASVSPTLDKSKTPAVAFTAKDYGADAGELSPTLRSGSHNRSHANGGIMPAVAFMENVRHELRTSEQTDALSRGGGKPGQGYAAAPQGSQVRRLTPRECERLQGFPDDYTLISYRGKPAADGPRYKALGNSMAVPCMFWIGKRIAMVEAMTNG